MLKSFSSKSLILKCLKHLSNNWRHFTKKCLLSWKLKMRRTFQNKSANNLKIIKNLECPTDLCVELDKCCKMSLQFQKSASTQPRTGLGKVQKTHHLEATMVIATLIAAEGARFTGRVKSNANELEHFYGVNLEQGHPGKADRWGRNSISWRTIGKS